MTRIPRAVWAITALHLLLLLSYSVLFAPFRGPDEPQHVDLVRAVRRESGYPRYDERYLSEAVYNALPLVRFDVPAVRSRHLPESAAPPRAQRPSFSALGDDDVSIRHERNQLASHPPLYYGLAAAVQTGIRAVVPGAAQWPFDREVAVLRLMNVLLLAPLPLLAFAVARRLRWSGPVAIGASAVPLAIPQLTHVGSVVTNDDLLTLLVGVATLLVARVLAGERGWGNALGLGLVAGLAMLTKAFALFMPLWIAVAYFAATRRGGLRTSAAIARTCAAVGVSIAVGGWWWIRNVVVHRALTPGIKLLPPASSAFEPDAAWWLRRFGSFFPWRFWGWFGWFDVRLPAVAVIVATVVVVVAVGAAVAVSTRRHQLTNVVMLLIPVLAIGALVALGAFQGYLRTGFDEGIQGRYLFPGVVGLSAVVALGAAAIVPRGERFLPAAMLSMTIAMQAVALGVVVRFYWGGTTPVGRLSSALAWSPWPPAVVVTLWLATMAAAALALWQTAGFARRPALRRVARRDARAA